MLHLKHPAAGLDLGVQTSTTATVAGEEEKEAGWSWGRIFFRPPACDHLIL